jgi:hypothetical protein
MTESDIKLRMRCGVCRCGVPLEPREISVSYLDSAFLLSCSAAPSVGQTLVRRTGTGEDDRG